MQEQHEELAWRIGGPQGSGIDRLSSVFGLLCAASGLQVFGRREYHSNIIGRHSYFDYCISSSPVGSHHETPYLVVTFDAESLCRHTPAVADGGYILYAAEDAEVALDELPFIDRRLRESLRAPLEQAGQPQNLQGLLSQAQARGVNTIAVPYKSILANLADECQLSRRQTGRAINTVAVSASAALLGFSSSLLIKVVEQVFAGKPAALDLNRQAVYQAYAFIDQQDITINGVEWLHKQKQDSQTLLIDGSQSVALGKLAAGMAFQTYYPISPASDESLFLESQAPAPLAGGGHTAPLVLQVEDELADATMACGAALTGARSATSTSGPGFCLMTEALGWAGMNEVPLVISLYQRGGPSTGLPTRTEQGDLQFAIHAGHSEFPRAVLASGDIEDCFHDAMDAFDLAERYQMPVIHMTDKALASSKQTLRRFEYRHKTIDRGLLYHPDQAAAAVQRFELTESGISPRPVLGQAHAQHWTTGAEHDTEGQVCEDPAMRELMMQKRMGKLQQLLDDLTEQQKLRVHGDPSAQLTVLTWGSSKSAVFTAIDRLLRQGIPARALQLRLCWPFPADDLEKWLAEAGPLVIAECNYTGQLHNLLRQQLGRHADHLLLKYNGRPMSADAVCSALLQIQAGNGEARMVLHNANE